MATYLFVYHVGKKPEIKKDMKRVIKAWGECLGGLADMVVDGGYSAGLPNIALSNFSLVQYGGANRLILLLDCSRLA